MDSNPAPDILVKIVHCKL